MNHQTKLKLGISALALLGVGLTSQALADEAPAKPAAKDAAHEETVVITGFRASLQSALSTKRRENSMVDVIKSDDIAQFPDLNLANPFNGFRAYLLTAMAAKAGQSQCVA